MCLPIVAAGAGAAASATALNVALTASLAGSLIGAYGQYQAGETQADIANVNAKQAEQQAADAASIGAVEEERYRRQVAALQGRQRAAFAGNGVDFTSGTPLGVLTETAKTGELDALTIRTNAMRQAWGYKAQAANYRAEGALARRSSRYNAASTVLTGGAQAYGLYR